jgi:hypothetical protein
MNAFKLMQAPTMHCLHQIAGDHRRSAEASGCTQDYMCLTLKKKEDACGLNEWWMNA